MDAPLIREQYKVTHVLHGEKDYAALLAVDIRSREKQTVLLNVYEGPYRKTYVPFFHDLRACPSFRELFLWQESLVAVFAWRQGPSIDQVFFKGAAVDWQLRLRMANALMEKALAMSDLPPEISCPALLSDNIRVFPQEGGLEVLYAVYPMEGMNQRELVFLLTDQLQKLLPIRWESPKAERRLIRELAQGGEKTAVAAYGKWKTALEEIRGEYEQMQARASLSRWLRLLWLNLSDAVVTKWKGRGSGR